MIDCYTVHILLFFKGKSRSNKDGRKMDSYKLPEEWIDRIFKRLAEIYGTKFYERFSNPSYVDIEKFRWRSGLYGVTPEEIKHALDLCRNGIIHEPPNVIEFFHYCKRVRQPSIPKKTEYTRTEAQIKNGAKYIKLIMDKLHGRLDSEGQAALSALDKQVLPKPDDKNSHWQDG